jgi:hypothetical protein
MTSTQYNSAFGEYRTLTSLVDQLCSEKKFDQLRSYRELILDDDCRLLDCGASFTKRGLEALCKFANMPASMLEWMIRKDYKPELAKFINSELIGLTFEDEQTGRPAKRIFSRFREDDNQNTVCRALFSDRYEKLDGSMILQMIADALPASERHGAVVKQLQYDGDELTCNLVIQGSDRQVSGEGYLVGVNIQLSECGKFRTQLKPWLGRLLCSNGLIVNTPFGEGISKRHIGRIDHQQLAADIRRMVGSAAAHADQALWQLDSGKKVVLNSPERVIIYLGRESRLTTDQINRWIAGHKATLLEPSVDEVSAFSIINGLTASARRQEVSSIERVYLESLGGRLIAPSLGATYTDIEAAWQKTEMKANLLSDEVVSAYEI